MNAPAQAAVGAGDYVFPTDNPGIPADTVGDQLGMLHHVGCMTDHSWDQPATIRKPSCLIACGQFPAEGAFQAAWEAGG